MENSVLSSDGVTTAKVPDVYRLVIDDLRNFSFEADYARDSQTGRGMLKIADRIGLHIDELWLDHDLGGSDTIYPVVHWLEEKGFFETPANIGKIYIHTSNPVGRASMKAALERYYNVEVIDPKPYLIGVDMSRPNPDTILAKLCGYDD